MTLAVDLGHKATQQKIQSVFCCPLSKAKFDLKDDLSKNMRFLDSLHTQAAEAQMSLGKCVVSPEPSFLAYSKY